MSDESLDAGSHDLPVPPLLTEFLLDAWADLDEPADVHPQVAPWAAKRRAREQVRSAVPCERLECMVSIAGCRFARTT